MDRNRCKITTNQKTSQTDSVTTVIIVIILYYQINQLTFGRITTFYFGSF